MGYYSTLRGEITIQPPLRWHEIKTSPFLPSEHQDRYIKFRMEETTTDTDDGVLTTRQAIAIEDAYGDSGKYYGVEEDLAALVAAHPGRRWLGYLIRIGEDAGDVERYRIDDEGRVISEKAAMFWPDGSPVTEVGR